MWSFTIKNKLTAAALLFTVLCLVMLTNLQEQRMISRINKAVTSIYEDRVVVSNYILNLSNHIEDVIAILKTSTETNKVQPIEIQLNKINRINDLYDKTILTDIEQSNFNEFKILCEEIKSYNKSQDIENALIVSKKAHNILETLSSIQVEESKSKLDEVLNMTQTSNLLSYLEIVVLIIIAVLIQILVLSSKTLLVKKQTNSNHHLN